MDKKWSLAFILYLLTNNSGYTISRNYPYNGVQIPQIGLTYNLYLPYPEKQVLLVFNYKYEKI